MKEFDKDDKIFFETSDLAVFPIPIRLEEINQFLFTFRNVKSLSKEEIISLAFKFQSNGNIEQAIKYYKYFIERGFQDPRILSNYGVILQKQGDTQKAIQLYKESIRIFPTNSDAYCNLDLSTNKCKHDVEFYNYYMSLETYKETLDPTTLFILSNGHKPEGI